MMATATKQNGYGYAPGYGKVGGAPKLNTTPKFGTPALKQAPPGLPSFNAYTPPAAGAQAGAQAGAAPTLSTAGSGGGVAADPRDPTYWTDIAKIKNTFGTNTTSYDLQETQGRTSLNNSLAALDRQQPIDTSNQRGQYNNAGLFYSTKLTSAESELTHGYDTNRGNARQGFGNLVDQLTILRKSNKDTYGEGGTAYLDALNAGVGRASEADRLAAQANMLVGPQDDGGGGAPAPQGGQWNQDPKINAAIQRLVDRPYYVSDLGGGKLMHVYPDGRKVVVKK